MGNHISCFSPAASNYKKNPIKVFHVETTALSELEGPVTAAEVMIDFPAQFLCCVSSVAATGRRICAIPAHADLRASEIYILLPMQKLNTRFSADDMAFFDALARGDSRRKKGRMTQSKVAPLPASNPSADQSFHSEAFCAHTAIGSQSNFKQLRVGLESTVQEPPPYLKGGMHKSKSWMPKLETIAEVHAAS